jgi:SulP family sulfate permease
MGVVRFWWTPDGAVLGQVDWQAIINQSGSLLALVFVVGVVMLLNATGIELAADEDADLDRELKSIGAANLVSGLCGGLIGAVSSSRTLLSYRAGANSRLTGLVAALFAALILFRGASSLLASLPKSILGGLLLYLGLSLLGRWLIRTWSQLNRIDYAVIWIILLTVALVGFLEGIGVGIVIASVIFTLSYSRLSVIKHELSGAEHRSNRARSMAQEQWLQQNGQQIQLFCLQGYLFFGTTNVLLESVQRRLADETLPEVRYLVFDFHRVSGMDVSALMSFAKLRRLTTARRIKLIFTDLTAAMTGQF